MKRLTIILVLITLFGCDLTNSKLAKPESSCNWSDSQKEIAWKNVRLGLIAKYPDSVEFCEIEGPANNQYFEKVNGGCRVYLRCDKSINGRTLHHGDLIVELNLNSHKVIGFYNEAW